MEPKPVATLRSYFEFFRHLYGFTSSVYVDVQVSKSVIAYYV
jgi:hypothetical protein